MKHSLSWSITLAVLSLSLFSCERTEMAVSDELTSDGDVFYAKIEQPQGAETKAYVDENYKVLWHADDHISIFNYNTFNREYRFLGQTGVNYGRFEMVPDDSFVTGNELEHIYAIYPFKESNYVTNDEVMQVELPAIQPYAENSFAQGINTMVSVVDSKELIFKNACGYLGVKLYGENIGVYSIALQGNDGELISGQAEIRMEVGGVPELAMVDQDTDFQKQVSLTCDQDVILGATEEVYTEFWFVLPPMTFEHGLTVTVYGNKGIAYVKSTDASITIERSKIVHLAPVCVTDLPQTVYYSGPVSGESDWSLIGTLSRVPDNNPWESDWPAVQDGDIHVIRNVWLTAADEFKIRKYGDWGVNRGGEFVELGKSFKCLQHGPNVAVGADGIFDIYYNAALEQMAVCLPGEMPQWQVGTVGLAVDLGLSVKWASWNVGASAPEQYGEYYAWGETTDKIGVDYYRFGWYSYKWCQGSYDTLTKYNTLIMYGTTDAKTQLDLEDDAACVFWGAPWRMPTDDEWTELRESCTWNWTTQNGVAGYRVTSNINFESIFLPAAGCLHETSLTEAGSTGYYWSSTLSTDKTYQARSVCFRSDLYARFYGNRFNGFSVRPVRE